MIWIRSSKYLQFQAPVFATHQVRNNFTVSPPTATTANLSKDRSRKIHGRNEWQIAAEMAYLAVKAGGFVEMSPLFPHGWLMSRGTTPPIFPPCTL